MECGVGAEHWLEADLAGDGAKYAGSVWVQIVLYDLETRGGRLGFGEGHHCLVLRGGDRESSMETGGLGQTSASTFGVFQ